MEDHAEVGPPERLVADISEVLTESDIVFEPPESRAGNEQKFRPSSVQGFEVIYRVVACGRVITGIGAIRVLGEMLGDSSLQFEQVGIALGDYEYTGTGGDDPPDDLPDPGDLPLVNSIRTVSMRLPGDAPLASNRSRLAFSNAWNWIDESKVLNETPPKWWTKMSSAQNRRYPFARRRIA